MYNLNSFKYSFVLLMCACASLAAKEKAATLPMAEAKQLKQDISVIKAQAYNKIAEDPHYSAEKKEELLNRLDKMELPTKEIQKLADEQGVSDHRKSQVIKSLRKLAKKADHLLGKQKPEKTDEE